MVSTATVVSIENTIQRELEEKRAVLEALEAELLQQELELAMLQGELGAFERRYMRVVGILQAKLDELDVRIADTLLKIFPDNQKVKDYVRQTHLYAWESAQAAGFGNDFGDNGFQRVNPHIPLEFCERFQPSTDLKQYYREIAKQIHPDLAIDEEERSLRTKLMIEANIAFQEGDEVRLHSILHTWENSPHHLKGEDQQTKLTRLTLRISQIRERLLAIEREYTELVHSDLYQIKKEVEEAETQGIDLLKAMAERLQDRIYQREDKLRELQPYLEAEIL